MTAVAPPLNGFQSSRWTPSGTSEFGSTADEGATRMFGAGPRKTAQRQNSSSSIASTASNSSTSTTISAPVSSNTTGTQPSEAGSWATRKKPTRGVWPPGKAEPATGLSNARPQAVSSVSSGQTASAVISALNGPLLPSQQMANGTLPANGAMRERVAPLPQAVLQLLPMNGTFERKTITIPYQPDALRIGRQTNQKTMPTPSNGFFDSKVLSRQHAEVFADLSGRIFIRDVKSSNGTFVNGMRLSQENKESEPRELHEQDVLELGIDIVSEDQKTVVHHKVAAKVEHAGPYPQGGDPLNFGDLDPSSGPAPLMGGPQQLRRNNSSGSLNGRAVGGQNLAHAGMGMAMPQSQLPKWLNPVTTEHLVRKLNNEQRFVEHQTAELRKARDLIEKMLLGGKVEPTTKESKIGSDKVKFSPTKGKLDLKSHFSEPPAPPPQAPLPEKPDVARALADPIIQPLLRRDLTRSPSANTSPTRTDHSSDILRLCEELKLAKGEITTQTQRMKHLENELAQERTARESAEERAQQLEHAERRDSPTENVPTPAEAVPPPPDLQVQLDRLRATMDEMKQQLESYRRRAETAESERDEVRLSLAEMIELRRKENLEEVASRSDKSPKSPKSPKAQQHNATSPGKKSDASSDTEGTNGHILAPVSLPSSSSTTASAADITENASRAITNGSITSDAKSSPPAPESALEVETADSLLRRAGLVAGQPLSREDALLLAQLLSKEFRLPSAASLSTSKDHAGNATRLIDPASDKLYYYGVPYGSFAAVVLLGWVAMSWINSASQVGLGKVVGADR